MLGPIITAGVGYVAFRLGMSAQEKSSKGKSCGEIAKELSEEVCSSVSNAYEYCENAIMSLFGSSDEYEGSEETEAKAKSKKKNSKKSKKSKGGNGGNPSKTPNKAKPVNAEKAVEPKPGSAK